MTPDMDRHFRARSAFSAISARPASERRAAIAKNHSDGAGANRTAIISSWIVIFLTE
jgi:hypothetical protein